MKNTSNENPSIPDLKLFLNLFQGREGVFARQWADGQGYSPVRPERSTNPGDILLHIRGAETYGIYPIRKDNTAKLVCFDIDLPKNFAEVDEEALVNDKSSLLTQVKNICTTAMDALLDWSFNSRGILIEDTGGRGYHIWMFFESSVPAAIARKFAYSILTKAEVQCEVFPKQDEVAKGQYGNLIKLPLGLHKKYKQYSKLIDITEGKISSLEDPFSHLAEIVPIPVSIILKMTQKRVEVRDPKHPGPTEVITAAKATPKKISGKNVKSPRIGDLIGKCRALLHLKEKAVSQRHLEHGERLALAYIMVNTEDGEEVLHHILSNCSDYDSNRTQKEIDYLKARGMKPISCRRLVEQGICDKFCRSEIRQQSMDPNRSEPSPVRFALWKDLTDPESIWETDDLSFENVYRKSNLYRAWEQIKDYARTNEAFFDIHAFEYFEEHLEENIETLRFELRNHAYSPAPYRWYLIPKERKEDNFEYRRMAFVHPRDYVVIQAIINVIGPTFEKSFSNNSCLGYRLDTEGKTGHSIFYSWQSAWQIRKKRVTSFLYHPQHYHYIKADIFHFYDEIDRVRLYNLILDKIGSELEICRILKDFLENIYIDDVNGKEKICEPPPKGIPQGPAFSPFFSNIYLNDLDHLIEKNSFDYVRYVDDMVILCEDASEVENIKKILEDYLSSQGLELNPDKTTGPCPVTNNEPLLDFLGEIKYGMAGLFMRGPYAEQLITHQFLKTKLDDLLNIKKLNIYDLEEIAKHLSYYLRMHEIIEPKINDLAILLSKKVLMEYALKPQHLVTVLEVLIRNEVDLSAVISNHQYPYIRIVLCMVLNIYKKIPPWTESLLTDFIEDKSSYILRGVAYSTLSIVSKEKYEDKVLNVITQEDCPYVIDRSLDCLITIRSDRAKMSFLELVKKSFEGSFNAMVKSAIKFGDSMLDGLIKNQMKTFGKVNIPDLYIVVEFAFIICPEDFEELLLMFVSEEKALLLRQLLLSSLDEINKEAAKRGYLTFAHQLTVNDRVRRLKANWLQNTLQEAIGEWRIGTTELGPSTALSDVNHWLSQGDENKRYQKVQNLSSGEHTRQGGYQSWIVRDEKNTKFVLEAVDEDILKEQKVIGNHVTKEYIKEQLESNKLSTLSDCFENVEGGKKYLWFKYMIPDGYDILYNVYSKRKTEGKFDEQELLNIVSALFGQVELIKGCIGLEPVINLYTVIVGEGNQVQLVNLFFGIPRKLFVSAEKNTIVDNSTTTNAFFNGLLACELISSKCPIVICKKVQSTIELTPQLVSDYLQNVGISLHFAWILDRLCYPTNPQNRYGSLSTLKKDIECFQKFRSHFKDRRLIDLSPDKKYWAEVLNVLNLRVARFLKLPYKIYDSIHENIIQVFNLTVHGVAKALTDTRNTYASDIDWESKSLILKHGISNYLHEAGYKCNLFATGIRQEILSISQITQWSIVPSIPVIILYIPLKLELVGLARAIGLFEIYDKDEIKTAVVRLVGSEDLFMHFVTDVSLGNFLATSPQAIKIVSLMNLFLNKRFQDVINSDASEIALLTLVILILLKNQKELWKKWCACLGLSSKNNLTKAVERLKYITENSLEIDRLVTKFLNEPLDKTLEAENTLIRLYNSCFRDIFKLRGIMRINRKRTFVVQDFHHLEKEVVFKFGRKKKNASHDAIIPFPPCYETIWRKESITVDSVRSGKNNKIKSLSLTPTRLKKIVGWKHENILIKYWNRMKRYSRKVLWKIVALISSFLCLLSFCFVGEVLGGILLAISCLLWSPLIGEWYSKIRKT